MDRPIPWTGHALLHLSALKPALLKARGKASPPHLPNISAGRSSHQALEAAGEVALVGEPSLKSGIRYAVSFMKKLPSLAYPALHLVIVRRDAHCRDKSALKMERTETGDLRELIQGDVSGVVRPDKFTGPCDGIFSWSGIGRGGLKITMSNDEIAQERKKEGLPAGVGGFDE